MNHIRWGFILLASWIIILAILVTALRANGLAWVSYWDYITQKMPAIVANKEIIYTQEMEDKRIALERAKVSKPVKVTPKVEKNQEKPKEVEIDTLTLGQKAWLWKTFSAQDNARLERIAICQEMYDKHKDRITYEDNVVIRCATMMTLQYAFESGHGKSKKCVNQRNCYGIKNNKRDRCIKSSNWFCTYSAQIEWSRDYAEMFMKHYEGYKSLKWYLGVYSPDGNTAYHKFVISKYPATFEWFKNNPAY